MFTSTAGKCAIAATIAIGLQIVSSTVYQCQDSMDKGGQVSTPDIPDSYFDPTQYTSFSINFYLTPTTNGVTYFFTIPPESAERNCSGTVVAIQYCYLVSGEFINRSQNVFSVHPVIRDRFVFTVQVISSFTVRTSPRKEGECQLISENAYLCCDTATLSADNQISISPERYTYAITGVYNSEVTLYAFRDSTEFVVEQFQASLGAAAGGTSHNLEAANVEEGVLLMRFWIDETEARLVPSTIMASGSISQSTVPEADSSDPPSSGGIVGGAIVGVVLVGVVVIMVCAVLVSVKHRSKRERLKIQEQSGSTISVHGHDSAHHSPPSSCTVMNIKMVQNGAYAATANPADVEYATIDDSLWCSAQTAKGSPGRSNNFHQL